MTDFWAIDPVSNIKTFLGVLYTGRQDISFIYCSTLDYCTTNIQGFTWTAKISTGRDGEKIDG